MMIATSILVFMLVHGRAVRPLNNIPIVWYDMYSSRRGVLRYLSDGNVRSPFFGFEICDLRIFLGLKFCSDFFCVRDFGKDFFGG